MKESVERRIVVANELGLHARPAALFVQKAAGFKAKITLTKDEMAADAKSLLDVMALGADCGSVVLIKAAGPDARDAVRELAEMLEARYE